MSARRFFTSYINSAEFTQIVDNKSSLSTLKKNYDKFAIPEKFFYKKQPRISVFVDELNYQIDRLYHNRFKSDYVDESNRNRDNHIVKLIQVVQFIQMFFKQGYRVIIFSDMSLDDVISFMDWVWWYKPM